MTTWSTKKEKKSAKWNQSDILVNLWISCATHDYKREKLIDNS